MGKLWIRYMKQFTKLQSDRPGLCSQVWLTPKPANLITLLGTIKVGPAEHVGQNKEYNMGTYSQRYLRSQGSLMPSSPQVVLPLQENKQAQPLPAGGRVPRGLCIDLGSWPWLFSTGLTGEGRATISNNFSITVLSLWPLQFWDQVQGEGWPTAGGKCSQPSERCGNWPEIRSSPLILSVKILRISA